MFINVISYFDFFFQIVNNISKVFLPKPCFGDSVAIINKLFKFNSLNRLRRRILTMFNFEKNFLAHGALTGKTIKKLYSFIHIGYMVEFIPYLEITFHSWNVKLFFFVTRFSLSLVSFDANRNVFPILFYIWKHHISSIKLVFCICQHPVIPKLQIYYLF